VNYFCHLCDFMTGLISKPKLYAKFKITSFSCCRYILGEPLILGVSLAQGTRTYCYVCYFMMGLGKPQQHAKFEVASFSRCRNFKKWNPKRLWSFPSLACVCDFIMGLDKPQQHAKLEVAGQTEVATNVE